MATGIYSWSQTAASNGSADSAINFAEGQAPSTLNDSCRGVMSVLSKWRDDISGVSTANTILTTGGTANAQTLTTNGSIAALTNGWTVSFKAGASNTGACTLALDGLTAKNIQCVSGTNLVGGEILAGCVYTVTYHQPADTFVLHGGPRPAMLFLKSGTVSVAATSDHVLTDYAGFRAIKFMLTGIRPSTSGVSFGMRFSTDGGANYGAGASDYNYFRVDEGCFEGTSVGFGADAANDEIVLLGDQGNSSTKLGNLELTLWNRNQTGQTTVQWHGTRLAADDETLMAVGSAASWNEQNTDAVRFLMSSGNIEEMAYAIYGCL